MASQVTVAATNRVHRHELSIGCSIFDLQVRMTDAQTDELHAVWTMLPLWSLDSTLVMICHVTVTDHHLVGLVTQQRLGGRLPSLLVPEGYFIGLMAHISYLFI